MKAAGSWRSAVLLLISGLTALLPVPLTSAQEQAYRVVVVGNPVAASRQWIEDSVALAHRYLAGVGFINATPPTDWPRPTLWIFTEAEKERFFAELVRAGVTTWPIDEVRQRFAGTSLLLSSLTLTLYVRADSELVRPGTRYGLAKYSAGLFGMYAFTGKDGIGALTWLREGHTEYYAGHIIEAGGGTSYAENRRDAVDNARRFLAAGPPLSLRDLETFEQWQTAQNARRLRAYGIFWLAYEYLEQRFGRDKVKEYFTLFKASAERANFEKAFGITPEAFTDEFAGRLRTVLQ